ncbi:MAG: serine/threonine protein kinase [Kofleriaceae bacterium]|nr:serine/threonine protein kinase [Kofleriaceae bacterium]MCL4226113.1 serine/threonine-protein kinase [Myxococcales bacterium]
MTKAAEPGSDNVATGDTVAAAGDAHTVPAAAGGAAAADYSELGVVASEHYADRRVLTHGGMGRIVTARDRRLRRPVAIKELRTDSPTLRVRFEREALLTARLQHPSIVSIHEAGHWPTGEPFYAMKLVPGRSLDKVIADAGTASERLALLPHGIALADALAYAHNARVIHRDLKPQNVMVGDFGETVVIDWGLAKDLDDRSAEVDAAARAPAGSRAGETEIGDVLGTPAYMPPEQAEGAAVDERADVYAIGAILYHMLAGTPPYSATSSDDIIEMVKRAPPVPLAERQAGVPPDLLAVVDRAMARDPAARYPTARELGEDLRRFQAGQLVGAHQYSLGQLVRRWLRRHRAAVAVAGVAAMILVVVGVLSVGRIMREQRRADAARALAEAHRAEAEELMDFMLGDLRAKLEPIGRLDVLDVVARKATDYYELRPGARSDDEQRRRALAQTNLGDVLVAQGDLPAALASYRAALAIRETLAAADPDHATWQRELSVSHDRIADVSRLQGDLPAALAAYRRSLAIAEALAAQDPNDAVGQRDLSISHERVGDVLVAQGDAPAALASYRAALAIREARVARDPSDVTALRDLSVGHVKVGQVLVAQGDLPAALAAYRQSSAIAETLTARDPSNAIWQRERAIGHAMVGNVLFKQEDLPAALASYRSFLEIVEKLAATDPSNALRQRDLSVGYSKIGRVLVAQGDLQAGLAAHRESLAIDETLAAKDPSNATGQSDLAVSHYNVGEVLLAQGDRSGALAAFRAALAIREKLAAQDPSNATWQRNLAELRETVATCCR